MLTSTSNRHAFQTLDQRLFPLEDVAALHLLRRRVVIRDLAGDVHPERDELVAVPAHVANGLPARPLQPLAGIRARRRARRNWYDDHENGATRDSCRMSLTSTRT